ncbi:hypothetical protein [Rhodanobacter sp. C05]|uniref:hypothetical protein n=1 Tax=Rhodanobacter sp. C05 TaxID=1945855 RepID=UPI00117A3395|nr:hypothetical protein [Rhodanobacter sp. C05]
MKIKCLNAGGWVACIEKMFPIILLSAFFISVIISLFIGDYLINNWHINAFISLIGKIVPAVNKISNETDYKSLAKISIALQWLYFPVYLFMLCAMQPFWKKFEPKKIITSSARKKGIWSFAFLFLICGALAMADFGFIRCSIFRGDFFNPDYSVFWLRLPYEGRFGLAIAAFMMPILSSFIYWFLPFSFGAIFRFFWRIMTSLNKT